MKREDGLDATSGFGQPCHLTGAFARPGGEQLIDMLQLEAGHLGENPYHGGDAVLLIIILEHIDNLPVLLGEFLDALRVLHIIHPFLAPLIQVLQEAVFVNAESFTFVFDSGHADISSLIFLSPGFGLSTYVIVKILSRIKTL
jgi:hypothetical protein